MKPMKPMYVIIIAIVVAAAAFYGGLTYEKGKVASSFASAGGRFGSRYGGGQGGFQGGGTGAGGASGMMRPISGQIVSTGSNTITVKLSDGSSKIVDLSSQTKINKTTQGTVSDLTTGQQVTTFGTANSDGSITAQAVNVGNGMMMRARSGGQGGASQSGQSGQ
jgi:hypothetical protein